MVQIASYHTYGWSQGGYLLLLLHDNMSVTGVVNVSEADAYALADYINQRRIDPKTEPEIPEPPKEFNVAEALLAYAKTHCPFTPTQATEAMKDTGVLTYKQVYGLVYQELQKSPRYKQDIETGLWSYKRGPGRPSKVEKIRESAETTPKALKAASKRRKK